jgi:hypothetical protein
VDLKSKKTHIYAAKIAQVSELMKSQIYPTGLKPLVASLLIDPVAFLRGGDWTGSLEIWMEVEPMNCNPKPKTNDHFTGSSHWFSTGTVCFVRAQHIITLTSS